MFARMREPQMIEHNKHERRPTMGIWWAAWAVIAMLWLGYALFVGFDWPSILLGAGTGIILAAWATDLTGNKFMG